jgi:REP element-mobilizing transposase RayT
MTAENSKRSPRLRRLEMIFVRSPVYFITTCTHNRKEILATEAVHESFVEFAKHRAWIGAYVFDAEPLHFFVMIDGEQVKLARWMRSLKNALSKTLRSASVLAPHWQKGFFDTSCAALSLIRRNGLMFARIRYALDLLKSGKVGRFAAKSFCWNIDPMPKDSAVIDHRHRTRIAFTETNSPSNDLTNHGRGSAVEV